ncbi:hypothetical protein [Kribbella sp. VKM Ac-2566]|jgi:hypothetical protein|uniref:hypothetical protein n=1 Tax=Kribbella sp. VKM Ac-2566 TaxID=2512218 RepID=UPI001062770B|nr:hypothetical protein [Kribbella sp. VKM Ac-2566]TDW89026.1 hypothetical protein EV647_6042 [Kribbella sp. VKM Ac-2566]
MAFGSKKAARSDAVANGGKLTGRQARKAAKEAVAGRLGEDGKVRDTRGKVIGNFAGRTPRTPNEHGV